MTTALAARTNRYPASCIRCGARIDADQGLLAKHPVTGKWAADHPADCPAKPAAAAEPVARVQQDGIYRTDDGTIYKVQIAKQGSGNLYAKLLTVTPNGTCGGCEDCDGEDACQTYSGTFTYAPGAINLLRADQRMTLEQAQAFGKLYGVCVRCGADLTDERSIEMGLGRICAGYFS